MLISGGCWLRMFLGPYTTSNHHLLICIVASKNSLGNALNMCIFKTSSVKESMKNGTNSRYYAHNEISLKFVIIERFSKNLHFKALLLCAQKS